MILVLDSDARFFSRFEEFPAITSVTRSSQPLAFISASSTPTVLRFGLWIDHLGRKHGDRQAGRQVGIMLKLLPRAYI